MTSVVLASKCGWEGQNFLALVNLQPAIFLLQTSISFTSTEVLHSLGFETGGTSDWRYQDLFHHLCEF